MDSLASNLVGNLVKHLVGNLQGSQVVNQVDNPVVSLQGSHLDVLVECRVGNQAESLLASLLVSRL